MKLKGWRKFILAIIIATAMVLVGFTADDAAIAHEIIIGLAAVFLGFAGGNGLEHLSLLRSKKDE